MSRCLLAVVLIAGLASVPTVVTPAIGWAADSCVESAGGLPLPIEASPCADVLAQETRWLTAITAGDVSTVGAILAPTYRHVNADGEMLDRAQEIADTEPLPVTFDATEQVVDIAGDTAVIHGINTISGDGVVTDTQRFTDVFVLQDGVWMALAAHETRW
jgi:ketosteroid isomerase-like protein